jgi:hypothetical protein
MSLDRILENNGHNIEVSRRLDTLSEAMQNLQRGMGTAASVQLVTNCFGPNVSHQAQLDVVSGWFTFENGIDGLVKVSQQAQNEIATVSLNDGQEPIGPTLEAFARYSQEEAQPKTPDLVQDLEKIVNDPNLRSKLLDGTAEGAKLRVLIGDLERIKRYALSGDTDYGNE